MKKKTVENAKIVGAVGLGAGACKAGSILIPKAITILKGSTLFMGEIAVPHYFIALAGVYVVVSVVDAVKRDNAKARDKKIKSGKIGKLLTLDEGDNDD